MYQEKIKVMNIISERMKKDDKIFKLIEYDESLGVLNVYIEKLIFSLCERPELVSIIIKNADLNDLKEIAPLFANNFYENILSSDYIENNLIYLLTLILKDEITNLSDINQESNFLNNTPCGILLEELRKKNDIQSFFRTIILSPIENLEVNNSTFQINFDIKLLSEEFKILKCSNDINKNNNLKSFTYNECFDNIYLEYKRNIRNKKKTQKEMEDFNKKYFPDLNKKSLLEIIENFKNNKNMYDYCNSKINDCNSNSEYYSNKQLFNNLYDTGFVEQLLLKYQNDFKVVISFINSIIENILNNFHLLPYSVKCLCKIISLLIYKKFPNVNEFEKNAFIGKFFFGKLLLPILKNPTIEAFINNFIISGNTNHNLNIICNIIEKFISGHFFNNSNDTCDYIPFNWYFMEKMGKLFDIFDKIEKIKIPDFLEKLIYNELSLDYEYNYFNENPDEVIIHNSVCFNLTQVQALLKVMKKCENQIFNNKKNIGLKKALEKLLDSQNQQTIKDFLNKKIFDNNQEKTVLYYFLFTKLLTNQQYNKLMNIEQKTSYFFNEELKNTSKESEMHNNIIKVKNFFCAILYNIKKLKKTDFNEGTIEYTVTILKELNTFIKSSNFVINESIPFNWYVNALLEYLQKIPHYLTNNDCEELYNEIENDLIKSIKELDFEALSVIIEKLKFAKRGKIYYEESRKILNDIKLNEETKKIIENEIIPFEIKFHLDEENEDENIFEINPSNIKEKDTSSIEKIKKYEKDKDVLLCLTIDNFTKKFPNLLEYQDKLNSDIFKIQKILQFPKKINSYFNEVEQILKKRGKTGVNLIINKKIYDYVMGKLYDNLYPIESYVEDDKIFQQSIKLSWIEMKHFINSKKKYIFGNFLNDALACYNLLDKEKSPRKKFLNVEKIFELIYYLLKFNNSGDDIGVDAQLPILAYVLIKSQPLTMFSNTKYMELYVQDRANLKGSYLAQMLGMCNFINELQYSKLFNITEEEFYSKCKEATSHQIKV